MYTETSKQQQGSPLKLNVSPGVLLVLIYKDIDLGINIGVTIARKQGKCCLIVT